MIVCFPCLQPVNAARCHSGRGSQCPCPRHTVDRDDGKESCSQVGETRYRPEELQEQFYQGEHQVKKYIYGSSSLLSLTLSPLFSLSRHPSLLSLPPILPFLPTHLPFSVPISLEPSPFLSSYLSLSTFLPPSHSTLPPSFPPGRSNTMWLNTVSPDMLLLGVDLRRL